MNLKLIFSTLLLLTPLALGNAGAASASVDVAMDKAAYSVADTMVAGAAPLATVVVTDGEAPVPGAAVRVVFLRQVQLAGYVSSETVTGTTDENGVFVAAAPQLSGLPGHYFVVAFVGSTTASTSYDVGA